MLIAICDDDEICLQGMKKQLSALSAADEISLFSNLKKFLASVEGGSIYDVVFMDIEWGQDGTGMDAAGELFKMSPETKVIYVTGHSDRYSQRIFLQPSNLSGFLTKPVDGELLKANLQKVSEAVSAGKEPFIAVRKGGAAIPVLLREISYIESRGHTIETHIAAGESIVSYGRLENVMESLGFGFYQCHKSFIVNMRQIQRFETNRIILKNGDVIPISRSKHKKAKEAYFEFMGHMF